MRVPGVRRIEMRLRRAKAVRARADRVCRSVGAIATCPQPDAGALKAGDQQVARNRLLLGLATALYLWFVTAIGDLANPVPAVLNALYLLVATSAFCLTRLSPKQFDILRKVMLIFDVAAISGAFIAAGPTMAPILFLYFWLVIGYGFRYGVYYLRLAAIASLAGILVALVFASFWDTQPFVAAGILMLAVVVPCYLELLMRRAIRANEIAKGREQQQGTDACKLGACASGST